MKIWRFIIVIIALGVFAFMFFHHDDISTDIPDVKTLHELNKDFGKPEGSTIIMLKKGISLYEYQSDLYNYIPDNDSLAVVQNTYRKGRILTVIWYKEKPNDSIEIISRLSWDEDYIQF